MSTSSCAPCCANRCGKRATRNVLETTDGRSIQIVNQPLAEWLIVFLPTQRDSPSRRHAEQQITVRICSHDSLTDLQNRAALFRQQLEQGTRANPAGEQLAVLYSNR